jgi:uncharacterized SAM-binding protein YcdF (DUF218 family)
MSITKLICSLWEVENSLPVGSVDAVVVMAFPNMTSGEVGKISKGLIECASKYIFSNTANKIYFSNYWPVIKRGISVAELEREFAIALGVEPERIIIPDNPRDPSIRNTYTEILFVITSLRNNKTGGDRKIKLHIVDNSLHMRRTLKTVRKILGKSDVFEITWQSVPMNKADYGRGYSQKRFIHPLVYMSYEIIFGQIVSRVKSWV